MEALWRFFEVQSLGIQLRRDILKVMLSKSIYIQVFVQSFRPDFEKKRTRILEMVFWWNVVLL